VNPRKANVKQMKRRYIESMAKIERI